MYIINYSYMMFEQILAFLLQILAGAGVGLAIGVTGIGGGSLMTPFLIFLGHPFSVAIGTDLLYATVTKAGGIVGHYYHGDIQWRIAMTMACGSLLSAPLTALALRYIFDNNGQYDNLLVISLGSMLILTALVTALRKIIVNNNLHKNNLALKWLQEHARITTFVGGLFLGVTVTLSSVGAGAVGTALLLMLYPKLKMTQIVGTDLAHAVPLTLVAGLSHLIILGTVNFLLLFSLLIGSLPAVYFGAKISSLLPENLLRNILAIILIVLGSYFVILPFLS